MAFRICICNSTEELLEYPVEQFTADLAERLSKESLVLKSQQKRLDIIRVIADQLLLEFKRKTVGLPPGAED